MNGSNGLAVHQPDRLQNSYGGLHGLPITQFGAYDGIDSRSFVYTPLTPGWTCLDTSSLSQALSEVLDTDDVKPEYSMNTANSHLNRRPDPNSILLSTSDNEAFNPLSTAFYSMSDWPLDILHSFLPHCSPPTLSRLSQTSKSFHTHCIPYLYRHLDLSYAHLKPPNPDPVWAARHRQEAWALQFAPALVQQEAIQYLLCNPEVAGHVREVKFTLGVSDGVQLYREFLELVGGAMGGLDALELDQHPLSNYEVFGDVLDELIQRFRGGRLGRVSRLLLNGREIEAKQDRMDCVTIGY